MKVLLVDDQALIRRGLTMLLQTSDQVTVVGEASDGHQALALVPTTAPDVVLSDARMPRMDGVALTRALAEHHPGLPCVILTTFDDEPLVRSALEAGAAGFLLKDSTTEDLLTALEAVRGGGLVLDPRIARLALTGQPAAPQHPPGLAALTRAERAVAAELATGATNTEIAQRLVLAEGTVKNHVSTLLHKLDQRDRTGLALLLYRYLGDQA